MVRALPCHGRGRGSESRSPRKPCLGRSKMPVKKQSKNVKTSRKPQVKVKPARGNLEALRAKNLSSQIKLSDSYISLFLGILVVVVVAVIGVLLFKREHGVLKDLKVFNGSSQENGQMMPKKERMYTVQDGDDLWSIAQKIYGSGFNWVDLAKANNLQDPDGIEQGMVLKVPDATVRTGDN